MTQTILLNGRFLSRPMTGVDRVAQELTRALAVTPEFTQTYHLQSIVPHRAFKSLTGHLWEQAYLSLISPSAPLLSLCNTGPILRSNQIVMLHDAQIHRCPESYAPAFRHGYRLFQPLLGRMAKTVLTVSDHSKSELELFGVLPPNKAIVLRNGADHILRHIADTSVLNRHNLRPNRYFLTVGAAAKHKNLSLIEHANRLRQSQAAPIVTVGHRPADSRLISLGRVSDAELRALYENATALLFPSRSEGFGLPAAEAMTCGCPVVTTNQGAIPEVCGTAALYQDPDDPQVWAKAMDDLENNTALRAHVITAGHRQIAPFTWANAALQLTGILNQHMAYPSAANPVGAA